MCTVQGDFYLSIFLEEVYVEAVEGAGGRDGPRRLGLRLIGLRHLQQEEEGDDGYAGEEEVEGPRAKALQPLSTG